jgi:predicted dehydrogenase
MVTIGIVGAGLRGRLFAEALQGRPDVTVVGLAEPSAKVAEEARAATGLPVTASHSELLEALDPDAVIVATPDFAHRRIAVDVAEAGKHLLIEKPIATTLDDALAIAAAVHRSGVRCLVGFENRWNPHVVQAKAATANLGDPITASATLSNSFFVPTTMLSWAAQSSPAWFLMPHTLDLILWLTDRTPVSVSAVGSRGVLAQRGIDTWDVVHALITQVIGTEGSVTVVSDKHRSVWPVSGRIGRSQVGPAVWMVQDFAAGLVDGGDLGPDIDHGVLVTRIICAIEDSISTGQAVRLTPPIG